MYKLIIAGGRDYADLPTLEDEVIYYFGKHSPLEIVSGTANGADKIGEEFAKMYGYNITRFPADWNQYGKSAGYIRNSEMAKYADGCICFWDGKSRGTSHMIDLANKNQLDLIVIKY